MAEWGLELRALGSHLSQLIPLSKVMLSVVSILACNPGVWSSWEIQASQQVSGRIFSLAPAFGVL